MPSEKRGFEGLDDLVTDVSEALAPNTTERPAAADPPPSPPNASREPGSSAPRCQAPSSPESQSQRTQKPRSPTSDDGGQWGWVAALIGLVLLVIFVATHKDEVPPAKVPPSAASPQSSIFADGIPNIDPDQDRLLRVLLQSAQTSEASVIESAATAIETFIKKPAVDKNLAKESRDKNKLGLQLFRQGRDDLAAGEFFAAFKLNPFDAEIADNLAYMLYNLGDYGASRKAYFFALAYSPRRSTAWGGLARVFAETSVKERAADAFVLAFHFSKSPNATRQAFLQSYREEKRIAAKTAIGDALAKNFSQNLADFLSPVLGNLAVVDIPILLPTKLSLRNPDGSPLPIHVSNNEVLKLEASADSFTIPISSVANCRSRDCAIGVIAGRRVKSSDIDEGDLVELANGVTGIIVSTPTQENPSLVFRVGAIRYTLSAGSDASAVVDAAKSAIKQGAIPSEVLVALPKLPFTGTRAPSQVAEPPIVSSPPVLAPSPPLPTPLSIRPTPAIDCHITFDVSLETLGEGVTVELRSGNPGTSTIIGVAHSVGGTVHFGNLCPGPYFLAIGNGDSVSVTPVRNFENNTSYTSTLRMQRGVGNVSSQRRNAL